MACVALFGIRMAPSSCCVDRSAYESTFLIAEPSYQTGRAGRRRVSRAVDRGLSATSPAASARRKKEIDGTLSAAAHHRGGPVQRRATADATERRRNRPSAAIRFGRGVAEYPLDRPTHSKRLRNRVRQLQRRQDGAARILADLVHQQRQRETRGGDETGASRKLQPPRTCAPAQPQSPRPRIPQDASRSAKLVISRNRPRAVAMRPRHNCATPPLNAALEHKHDRP